MHIRYLVNNKNFIYVSKTRIDKEFNSTLHLHGNLEILFISDGSGTINLINKKIDIKKHDILIINKGSKHVEISDEYLQFYAIGLKNALIMSEVDKTNNVLKIATPISMIEEFVHLYDSLFKELEEQKSNYDIIVDSYLNIILNKLLRVKNVSLTISEDNDKHFYNLLKNYIDNNYNQSIKLKDISNMLNVSVSTLCHKFKEISGITIFEYKINKQLEEAKNLLKISDMNIIEISNLVGFNSPSYFTKLFKIKYGISPKIYRVR